MIALMTRQFMESSVLDIGIDILLNLLGGETKLDVGRQISSEVISPDYNIDDLRSTKQPL